MSESHIRWNCGDRIGIKRIEAKTEEMICSYFYKKNNVENHYVNWLNLVLAAGLPAIVTQLQEDWANLLSS